MSRFLAQFTGALLIAVMFTVPAVASGLFDSADSPRQQQQIKNAREKISALKAERMKRAVGVDEKIAAQIKLISDRYEQRRDALRDEARGDMRELRESLGSRNEGRIKTALDQLEQRQQAYHALRAEERAELRQLLTTEQQAKYVLFQAAFTKELREKIRKIQDRRGGPSVR